MQGDGHGGDNAMGDEDAQGSEVDPEDEHYQGLHADGPHDLEHPSPLVNGHSLANPPSGSQELPEGSAVPVVSQENPNQNSQETISSTPHVQASQEATPPADAAPAASVQDVQSVAPDSQTDPAAPRLGKPLQAMDSIASTVPDLNQEQAEASPYASTVIDGEPIQAHDCEPTQPASQYGDEPPFVPESSDSATAANVLGEKIPSANRLSVSYAGATRRLVIDAEAVPKLKVFRSEGRIEVTISLTADERGGFRGIAVSVLAACLLGHIRSQLRMFRWKDVPRKARTSHWNYRSSSQTTTQFLLSGRLPSHLKSRLSSSSTRRNRCQSPAG